MSRFKDEFSIISRTGKLIAFLVWLVLTAGLYTLFATLGKPGDPPFWLRVYICVLVPVPLSIFALVVAYIHADAKRRAMRHEMWSWLAVLIPNGIGVILYFIFREPLMRTCAQCGAAARQTFAFCPACGAPLQPACPSCRRAVEAQWANCAYCGARLAA
ncbi:MAG: zinc ribbon domain-containing protein [Acidobacteria bacterium]|nr:zinc ribbon domain-containing protein [Acidobacteriota bacterium]